MICENGEFASIPKEVTTEDVKGAENSSAINAHDCYDYQSMQQLRELLSSNKNNILSSPADNRYYYYTTQAELQRQQNSLTSEQKANSDFDLGQRTEQKLVFPKGEMSTQQQFSPRHLVVENCTTVATTVTSILGYTWSVVTSGNSSSKRKSTSATTEASSSPINSVFAGADNSNWTFSNYGGTEEFCGSYPLNSTSPLDNPEARVAVDFTSNRLSEAHYSANTPGADISINSELAHQWHQRRDKLPAKRDTTFYTEWQMNRPRVVNTAEIQKRKLQLLQATAEEQLRRANQRKKNSTPRQTEQEKHEEQQQQHHLYRLHQAQQQNHLRSQTPDSLSSSRHFAHSPLSLNSSTASKQQQTFPYNHSEQTQMHDALLSSSDNSWYDFAAQLQQQQLLMQALQQQYLQQLLTQYCQPDFFEKLQELHQQRYQKALQENMSRHQSAHGSRQVSKKRKRQPQQQAPQKIADDKENASENPSGAALAIDESAIVSSNVQLQESKSGDDPKPSNVEGQVKENVIVHLADAKKLSGEKSLKSDESKGERSTSPALGPGGMWLNNFERLQNWLEMQQQNFVQNESGALQYRHSDPE